MSKTERTSGPKPKSPKKLYQMKGGKVRAIALLTHDDKRRLDRAARSEGLSVSTLLVNAMNLYFEQRNIL